ncbi:MAG TPA: rhodanese-like domain-containing protein [Desulfuromonadales bacterium]|nr:rhodanese-like domain-containing protein [Desulfuromonadales bacterium]
MNRDRLFYGLVVGFCSLALVLGGCSTDDPNEQEPVTPPPVDSGGDVSGTSATPSAELTEIADRVAAVLALGYNTTGPDAVAKALFDDDPNNDPFIVDTREPADYAAGHIPGAINIPLQELPQALLDGTAGIPGDQEVIVASYWGNDGNMASLLINTFRVADPAAQKAAAADAKPFPKSTALFQGMTSWSFKRELVPAGTRFDDAGAAGVIVEKSVESTPTSGTPQGAYPAFTPFLDTIDTTVAKILVRADNYLNSVPSQFDLQVYPADLAADLEDGDAANDPVVVSVRGGAHYALGHIPGSINIGYRNVADLANAELLDPTQPIVAYCYTGHTGSLSTMALGILGYPAKNLLYGMNGWSTSAPASGQLVNFDLMRGWDFPVNDGGADDLNSLADFEPETGCLGCHGDLTSVFYDREVANPPVAMEEPPSEGEG